MTGWNVSPPLSLQEDLFRCDCFPLLILEQNSRCGYSLIDWVHHLGLRFLAEGSNGLSSGPIHSLPFLRKEDLLPSRVW